MNLPSLGPRGEGWFALQLVLFILIAFAGTLGPALQGWPLLVTAYLGVVLMIGGVLLAIRGTVDLNGNLTPFPAPRARASLVQTGAYSLVRHPIYGGLIISAVGWAFATASPAALLGAVALAAFFDLKSRREERWLAERFGEYGTYRAHTHKLLPWIY